MAVLQLCPQPSKRSLHKSEKSAGCKSTARLAVAPTPRTLTHMTRGGVPQATELGKAALGAPNAAVKARADSGNGGIFSHLIL